MGSDELTDRGAGRAEKEWKMRRLWEGRTWRRKSVSANAVKSLANAAKSVATMAATDLQNWPGKVRDQKRRRRSLEGAGRRRGCWGARRKGAAPELGEGCAKYLLAGFIRFMEKNVGPRCQRQGGGRVRAAPNPPQIWAGFGVCRTARSFGMAMGASVGWRFFGPNPVRAVRPDVWGGFGASGWRCSKCTNII